MMADDGAQHRDGRRPRANDRLRSVITSTLEDNARTTRRDRGGRRSRSRSRDRDRRPARHVELAMDVDDAGRRGDRERERERVQPPGRLLQAAFKEAGRAPERRGGGMDVDTQGPSTSRPRGDVFARLEVGEREGGPRERREREDEERGRVRWFRLMFPSVLSLRL